MLEARAACDLFDITVEQVTLEISEIQSHDPLAIIIRKAADAFGQTKQPIVVADTFWNIPALHGFPGGYMKDVAQWFGPQDFIAVLAAKQDKRISFTESIMYKDAQQTKNFSRVYWGKMADQPRGATGNAWDKVAEFNGRTFAEGRDMCQTSHDPKDYVWYEFARWFSDISQV